MQLHDARRGADDERGLFLQRVNLPLHIRSADECLHTDREPRRRYELPRDAGNLHRELMCRREDEHLRRTHGGVDAHECGQEVGERLARSRRCLADQALARTRGRDERRLDLRGCRDAALCESGDEMLGHTERCKFHSLLLLE